MRNLIDKEKIVLVLTGFQDIGRIKKILAKAGWIELRFDCFFEKYGEKNLLKWARNVRELTDANIIATVRWHRERQNQDFIIPDEKRFEIYSLVAGYVNFFDVEIKSSFCGKVCDLARNYGIKTILSYHNFKKTPSNKNLISICQRAKMLRPEIIKIATMVKTTKDLFNLVSLAVSEKKHTEIAVIPMGTGILERLVPLAFGSIFTYFAVENKTAPGQPEIGSIL